MCGEVENSLETNPEVEQSYCGSGRLRRQASVRDTAYNKHLICSARIVTETKRRTFEDSPCSYQPDGVGGSFLTSYEVYGSL